MEVGLIINNYGSISYGGFKKTPEVNGAKGGRQSGKKRKIEYLILIFTFNLIYLECPRLGESKLWCSTREKK